MKALTQSEKDRLERTAYVALDAIDRLVGNGLGGNKTERALEAVREIINDIQNAQIRERRHKSKV